MFKNIFYALAMSAALVATPAFAQQNLRQITTQGTARVLASPSIGVVQAGAITQGKTAKEAMEANAKIMNGVLAGLKETGIPDKDIATTQVSLRPIIEYSRSTPKVTGYEAQNMLNIRVTALEKMGDALDKIIQAGANSIGEIQLLPLENKEKWDEARKLAVLHSRKNAEILVQAAGSKVGKVIALQENTQNFVQPRMRAMAADSAMKSSAPPIATGEQSQEVSVSVTWEIID
jgi:uncharacterized protein